MNPKRKGQKKKKGERRRMGVSINETAAEVGILFFETLAHPPSLSLSLSLSPSVRPWKGTKIAGCNAPSDYTTKAPPQVLGGANFKIIFLWTIATLDP
jgi:hypothetical protein